MTARPVLLPSGSGLIRQIWLTCGRGGTGHTPTASLWLPASAPMASAATALGRPQCARPTTNTNSVPAFPRVPTKQLPSANCIFHAHQRHLIKWQPPQCFPSQCVRQCQCQQFVCLGGDMQICAHSAIHLCVWT